MSRALLAHGVGGRTDLPVPPALAAAGAALALVISFVALAVFWRSPRLTGTGAGRPLPPAVSGLAGSSRVRTGVQAATLALSGLVCPLSYTIYVDGSVPIRVRAAQLVTEQLAEVGIAATVETLDSGALSDLLDSKDYDIYVNNITAHGVADPTQFIMSHFSGYLWDLPEVPYPAFEALFEEWKAAATIDARAAVSFRMQQLFNEAPTSIPLHYPSGEVAYRPAAHDGWVESPGYGLVHKWSLLPRAVAADAGAILEPGR